jgi:SAM-dependent methyltransferase
MGIYGKYAEVYDGSGQILFAVQMIPYLEQLLNRHRFPGDRVLDLACGTGTVANYFAGKSYQVSGIDGSEEMLGQARKKTAEMGAVVDFSRQDMRDFAVAEPTGLVTCLYDSMNYMLTEEDLLIVMQRAAAALMPGGLFVFDINTEWMMEHALNNRTEFFESGPLSLVMVEEYDPDLKRATVKMTGFVRRGKLFERFTEVHCEQSYSEQQMYGLLQRAGFYIEGEYDCFHLDPPNRETKRIMWVARKSRQES